jgi:hypothetical protein
MSSSSLHNSVTRLLTSSASFRAGRPLRPRSYHAVYNLVVGNENLVPLYSDELVPRSLQGATPEHIQQSFQPHPALDVSLHGISIRRRV